MKKINICLSVVIFSTAFGLGIYSHTKTLKESDLNRREIEALASCKIEKKEKIYFQCLGEDGECKDTTMGYTLTCSGEKVE